MNKYAKRLYDEWITHGKIIIAVDYDDTISPWKLNTEKDILESNIIATLRGAKQVGAYIVAFTACNQDRHEEIKKRFEGLGIQLDTINQNPIELPYGNQSKVYANVFLDDRAGLNQALEDLDNALWQYKGYLEAQKITGEQAE